MQTGKLGERKIIELILGNLDEMPDMPVPFGDDISAIDIGQDRLAVMKSDMLVGKTDIPQGMNLWQAARKAVIMNISDLAAKGVQPIAILSSMGVPGDLSEREVEQIGKGLNSGAREYGAYILGGDTNEASDLIISCATFGICKKDQLIKRTGAKPNEYAAVTGFFGKTAAGLKIIQDKLEVPSNIRERLVNSVFLPSAKLKEGAILAEYQVATASIDSSDGLAWSLHEISKASNVGFVIDKLPVAPEVEDFAKIHCLSLKELCFYGGEEYELLVTIKPKFWQDAKDAVKKIGGALIRIGATTEKKGVFLKNRKRITPLVARGWEHFKTA